MQPDDGRNLHREALARQVLNECGKRGLKVWQQFGSAYVARPMRGQLESAPKALAAGSGGPFIRDCPPLGWGLRLGCTVERVPRSDCLLYRPERWHPALAGTAIGSGSAAA